MQRIHPSVEQLSTHFNGIGVELYFVRGKRSIIIDTGTRQSPEVDILPSLKNIGMTLSNIDLILNTHVHFDHTAGNTAVKAASGAQVFIHKNDAPFLINPHNFFELYSAPVIRAMGGNLDWEKVAFLERMGSALVPDKQLNDGDIIDAGYGVKLQVIHLPGHTPGSVGFFWEREGILFSGDAAGGLQVEGGSLPVILDLGEYMKSLQRLQEMPVRFLLCAHHYRGLHLLPNPVRQGIEVNEYLQDCQEFATRLDEAVRNVIVNLAERDFTQVSDEVITKLPREMGFKLLADLPRRIPSAQTIFFSLYQAGQHGILSKFKEGGDAR